jgi:hypothetical protein
VQKLAHIGAAAAHPLEPGRGHTAQFVVRHGEPSIDLGVSPDRAREPKEGIHPLRLPSCTLRNNARRR